MKNPWIPGGMVQQILRDASVETKVIEALRQGDQWRRSKPRPWYRRLWHRIDRYLPRVSVHLGPRDA